LPSFVTTHVREVGTFALASIQLRLHSRLQVAVKNSVNLLAWLFLIRSNKGMLLSLSYRHYHHAVFRGDFLKSRKLSGSSRTAHQTTGTGTYAKIVGSSLN
jgi:hypothetical protein